MLGRLSPLIVMLFLRERRDRGSKQQKKCGETDDSEYFHVLPPFVRSEATDVMRVDRLSR
jgi:hypothetical protein